MPIHETLSADDRAEIARLLKVANGTADHEHFSDSDYEEPELNYYKPQLSDAEEHEISRILAKAKTLK
jgi:hypothetical protein